MPSPNLLAITLGGTEGAVVFVYRFSGSPRGSGLVDARPRGNPADAFTQRLRKLIEGSVVTALSGGPGDRVVLALRRGDGRRTLCLEAGAKGQLWILDAAGALVAARDGRTGGTRVGETVDDALVQTAGDLDESALRTRGPALVAGLGREDLERRKRQLRRALLRATKSVERRITKIEADAARASEVDALRERASEILSHLHAYEAGANHLEITDYGADPPTKRRIDVDPAVGAKGESEALFRRARRLERGAVKAAERKRISEEELAGIGALLGRLDDLTDLAAVAALGEEAARAGVRGAREGAKKQKRNVAPMRRPYRRFNGHEGRAILVGRGAADNDALTLRHAKPSDLWLHARGYRGAHVVVPLGKREDCPPELLVDAATLAVHFSAAKGEDRVEVAHTPRRYVRKPRGAAPGAVMVDRERVIILRQEPERLAQLLANEERD